MAGCVTLTNRSKDCTRAVGGGKEVLIAESNSIEIITDDNNGTITGITMTTGTQFYKYEFLKELITFSEPPTYSSDNGTLYYAQSLNFPFNKNRVQERNEVKALTTGEFVVIYRDNEGNYKYLGEENGLDYSEGDGGSGKAFADRNGWDITLKGMEREPSKFVDPSIINALLSPAA